KMKSLPLEAFRPPAWRRLGSALALAASLGFAFQSTLVMAQATVEADVPAPAKPKPHKVAKKPTHKVMPSDNVADELNRREAERVAKMAQEPGRPAAAPLVHASLTPTVDNPPSVAPTPAPSAPAPIAAPDPVAPAPQPRQAQAAPPTPTPVQPPTAGPA